MKKTFWIVLIALPLQVFASSSDYSDREWLPGRLLVNFNEQAGNVQNIKSSPVSTGLSSLDALLEKYSVTEMQRLVDDATLSKIAFPPDFSRTVILYCPEFTDVLAMVTEFEANSYVDYAQPDLLHYLDDIEPDDALWNSQWDKRLMSLPRAWEFSTGSETIQVIAVDGGTCWDHPDFYDNLWVNPSEDLNGNGLPYSADDYPGDVDDLNGDDDGDNNKVDDFIGWDFIQNVGNCAPGEDCDPFQDNDPSSVGSHGTHVLGIMGAAGNNSIGVTGVNWNVSAMASRAGYQRNDGEGLIISSAAGACIAWAVALDVDVINMSFGSSSGSPFEQTAIENAWDNGCLLCGASGNDGVSSPHYPAAYPDVVAVGSTDDDDGVSNFSNYGTWVECYAPGSNITSTICNGGFGSLQGTSMASPNAAGIFALIWSIFPDLTNQELKDLVLNNCVNIDSINSDYNPNHLGFGRVDAARVLASVYPYLRADHPAIENDLDQDGRLEPGESGELVLNYSNDAAWSEGTNIVMTVSSLNPNVMVSNPVFSIGTIAPGQTGNNQSNAPMLTASSNEQEPYYADIDVHFTGDNGLSLHQTITLRIGRPGVLLVDDDGGQFFSGFFENAIWDATDGGYNYDMWSSSLDGEVSYEGIEEYNQIIWVCGNETANTLTSTDMTALASYLDAGNSLLLSGRGIDDDATVTSNAFYANYLHVLSGGASGSSQLAGVEGDVISDGDTLLLIGGGCGGNGQGASQNVINPANGGVTFFRYTAANTSAAVRYDGAYKTAYCAFALEAACGNVNTVHHSVIISDVMEWFGALSTGAKDEILPAMPSTFSLNGNYPNPFNPSTTISFELGTLTFVTLSVFDILGREVVQLVNGNLPAGQHQTIFDGSGLASGIYLVNMQAGEFSQTSRMLLLK